MHVLLGGGSGFIGSFLTDRLIQRGDTVTIITRSPNSAKSKKGLSYVAWESDLGPEIEKADAVVNMAGSNLFDKRWTPQVKQTILRSRVDTTRILTQAILQSASRPEVFISFSAVGYYGDRSDEILTESSAPGNDFLADVCVQWENAAREVQGAGVRLVIPRVGIVKHPSEGALAKMLLPFRLFIGGPLGSGKQFYPWVHVDDVIGLLMHALDNSSAEGPVNVASPGICTMKTFARTLGTVMRRPSLFPVPEFVLRIAVGEVASAITASNRAIPEAAQKWGYQFSYPDLEPALRDLLKATA